jgi:CheY-like chemotaxis protein
MSQEPTLEHPAAANAKPEDQTWRILFLDNAENVEQLKMSCKEVGYVVAGATTLGEAWAFLDGKDHVDVIVCAAHLEQDSMFEFLQAVRKSAPHGKAKFLILSLEPGPVGARFDRTAKNASLALGADTYLVMPQFNAQELVAEIRKLQPVVPKLQQVATPEEKAAAQ